MTMVNDSEHERDYTLTPAKFVNNPQALFFTTVASAIAFCVAATCVKILHIHGDTLLPQTRGASYVRMQELYPNDNTSVEPVTNSFVSESPSSEQKQ
jgi:hypothetical protein